MSATRNQNEIRNIWAIGRNYRDHVAEMKAAIPKEPVIFLKAGSSASLGAEEVQLPDWSESVHYEGELALCFDEKLEVDAIALGLDLTERHRQAIAKKEGLPWTLAKSFKGSCVLTEFIKAPPLKDISFTLKLNGELKQHGLVSNMIFSPDQAISYLLKHFPVVPGDVFMTGTPEGVGPLKPGDRIEMEIPNLLKHSWLVK